MSARPLLDTSRRLESVRKAKGFETLKGFWQALTEDGDYDVSYEAVRNYHFNREAPAKHHAQVAKKFGVRLEWLITGEGERFQLEDELRRAEDQLQRGDLGKSAPTKGIDLSVVWAQYPFLRELSAATQMQFLEVSASYWFSLGVQPSEEYENISLQLAEIISRPSELLPKMEPYLWDWSHVTFDEYVQAMLLALKLATRVEPEETDWGSRDDTAAPPRA